MKMRGLTLASMAPQPGSVTLLRDYRECGRALAFLKIVSPSRNLLEKATIILRAGRAG